MATPIGNLGSYLLDGYAHGGSVREDLLDYITNISPYETPLTSILGRSTARSTLHEWTQDVLRARNTRGIVEGRDWAAPTAVAPTRVNNQTEIFGQDLGVTGTIIATWAGGIALGTVTATTGATLVGTEATWMPEVDVAAAVGSVATVDAVSVATALTESGARWVDGTTTPAPVFLNLVVDDSATHTSGTGTFTGTVTLTWINLGDK